MQADMEQALLVEEPSSMEDEVIDYEVTAHMASGCACVQLSRRRRARLKANACCAGATKHISVKQQKWHK